MSAILKITDGTTEVSLLNGPIYLESWLPAMPAYKGGGVFADSPIGDSRRMVFKRHTSTTESMSLKIANGTQDDTIRSLRNLQALLEKASDYWVSEHGNTPVYMISKASRESSARYATIIQGRVTGIGPIMAQPFTNCSDPVLDQVSLVLEHNHWNPNVPGVGSGTAISLTVGGNIKHNIAPKETNIDTAIALEPHWSDLAGAPDSIAVSTEQAYRGSVSTKVVTTGINDGIDCRLRTDDSLERTFTVWIYAETGTVEVFMADSGGGSSTGTASTTTGEWEEVSITATNGGGSGIEIGMRADTNPATWYFDWPQLYEQDALPLYDTQASKASLFVSNKQRHNAINYVYTYNNSTWSDNTQYDTSVPITIGGRFVDEATYFGSVYSISPSTSGLQNGGPFDNIIVDVSRAAAGTAYDPVWEYWGAGSWRTLTTVVDKTDLFQNTGETSVSWLPPSSWDFSQLSVTLSAGEGSAGAPSHSAYWVRLIINSGVTISEANRPQINALPYTVVWPYVDLGATTDLIGGDIEASGKLDITNYGGDANSEVSISVAADGDTWFDTAVGTNEHASTVLQTGTEYIAGMKFLSVPITLNSTILNAYITLIAADSAGQGVVRTDISCHDVDDSTTDLTTINMTDFQNLPRTSAHSWSLDGTTVAGQVFRTPNIWRQVAEVVNRAGWVSGNDMTFFIDDNVSDGTAEFTFASEDNVTYAAPELTVVWTDENGGVWINKCIAGVRDTARGEHFISHINLNDEKDQPGIEIIANASSYFLDHVLGAGGRAMNIDSSASLPIPTTSPGEISDDNYNIIVQFGNTTSTSYVGTYRAFLRFSSDLSGSDTANFSIAVRSGSTGITKFGHTSAEFGLGRGEGWGWGAVRPGTTHEVIPVDLGLISIPENPFGYDKISLLLAASATDTTAKLTLYDVILIPADEWIGEISTGAAANKSVYALESIHFDSISSPRRSISAYHLDEGGVVKAMLNAFTSRLVFSPTKVQRMYFLFNTIEREDTQEDVKQRSSPWGLVKVAASALSNYINMRGDDS